MNTENEFYFPDIRGFSFAVVQDALSQLTTKNEGALLVFRKDCEILVGPRLYSLKAGDAFLIPPFTLARPRNREDAFCGDCLTFPYEILSVLAPQALFRAANGGAAFLFPHEKRTCLCLALEQLVSQKALPIHIIPAVFSILEQDALPEKETSCEIPLPKILRKALAYINEHPDPSLDTSLLAARYGVSKSTLMRLFHAHLGITPLAYAKAVASLKN